MQTSSSGLRDRKRAMNRARMEAAAVELVLRDGLQNATVDAICEAADMSPRTFFNYFDSKEDAVLGLPDLELTDEAVLWHATNAPGGDVVEAVTGIIFDLTASIFANTSLHDARAEILRRHPELFNRQVARLTGITDELMRAVETLMAHDPRFSDSVTATAPLADPILALCAAAVRTATKEWIAAGGQAPVEDVRSRAFDISRDVVERLR